MRVARALYPGKCFALPGGPNSLLVVPGRRAPAGDHKGRPYATVGAGLVPALDVQPRPQAGVEAESGGVGLTEPPRSAGVGFAGVEAEKARA